MGTAESSYWTLTLYVLAKLKSATVFWLGLTIDKKRYQWLLDLTLLEEWTLPFGKIGVGAKQ